MPSQLHEILVTLFRSRPTLAPELLREALRIDVPVWLDAERSRMYFDLIHASLGEAVRRELQTMDPAKYEYQSELAKRLVAEGRAEGKAEGRAEGKAELLGRLLTQRFGTLGESVLARLADASLEELDRIGDRLMAAKTLDEALGKH